MRARILPPEEWGRLPIHTSAVLDQIPPEDVEVRVVEKDGEIVGCAARLRLTHLEGAWIAPEERGNAGVGRQLIRAMLESIEDEAMVLAASEDEVIQRLLQRMGALPLPVSPGTRGYMLKEDPCHTQTRLSSPLRRIHSRRETQEGAAWVG